LAAEAGLADRGGSAGPAASTGLAGAGGSARLAVSGGLAGASRPSASGSLPGFTCAVSVKKILPAAGVPGGWADATAAGVVAGGTDAGVAVGAAGRFAVSGAVRSTVA
jgi:hypothetical protein